MSNIYIVGGTFDENGGKPSKIVNDIMKYLEASGMNGGHIDALRTIDFKNISTLLWMPNIDNTIDKILPSIKEQNPFLLLISTKRVVEKDYTESDVIGRLLKSKSNLGIMIQKREKVYNFKLLDPLGNIWSNTSSVEELCSDLAERISFLKSLKRVKSKRIDSVKPFTIENEFIDVVKELGIRFARFVNAVNPNRLLGNAATRCSYGFPSLKREERIFVSKRNVEKTTLSSADFVEVFSENDDSVLYYGDNKPSVDTPIQLKLFKHFKNVNYIVHGHVYVKDSPLTKHKIPCGCIEEVSEIVSITSPDDTNFAINLRGHGCLIFSNNISYLRNIALIGRPFPETMV